MPAYAAIRNVYVFALLYFQSIITNGVTTMSSLSLNIAALRCLSKSTGVSWVTLASAPPPAYLHFVISQLLPFLAVVPGLGRDVSLLSSGYSLLPSCSVEQQDYSVTVCTTAEPTPFCL